MRRTLTLSLACLLGAAAIGLPTRPATAQNQPPHAWLFGSWTGGLFPTPAGLPVAACLAQPVVIFTRDVVMRASLTDPTYAQRVIETAHTNPGRTDFQFSPPQETSASGDVLGVTAPKPATGFGCESPNVLHVVRNSENSISFPGCADFPEPLVRCIAR